MPPKDGSAESVVPAALRVHAAALAHLRHSGGRSDDEIEQDAVVDDDGHVVCRLRRHSEPTLPAFWGAVVAFED